MRFRERAQRRRAYNEPGHAHELTFSCYRRYKFLEHEKTCIWLADAIDMARKDLDFSLWAYVFMPEHVHLIVWPKRLGYNVSEILGRTKNPVGRKAVAFLRREAPKWLQRIAEKRRRRTEYHFWQPGGGFDRNITEPATLEQMIEYIHMNPVRRRLVEQAVDWKWSSAGWFQRQGKNPLEPDPIPDQWAVGMSPD